MSSAIPIGVFELGLAAGFMLICGAISLALSLGLTRSLLTASLRTYLQLTLLGLVLKWIFSVATPFLLVAAFLVMLFAAAHTLGGRVEHKPEKLGAISFLSLLAPGIVVTFGVTTLVIGVEPWHSPQYVIPIAGMVIGNSMNSVAIALERLFSELSGRTGEIETKLALGATPWEAVKPMVTSAVKAGMIPTINSMNAAGIVFIPGMMTGQIIAGTDPSVASSYQIVILVMIAAATAIGAMIAVMMGYRSMFDERRRFTPPA